MKMKTKIMTSMNLGMMHMIVLKMTMMTNSMKIMTSRNLGKVHMIIMTMTMMKKVDGEYNYQI